MTDRPPPSRYKVIEQGGRLITIDTQADRQSATGDAARNADVDRPPPAANPGAVRIEPRRLARRPRGVLLSVATMMTETRTDASGNMVLRSHKFYDPAAPRLFVLTNAQAKQLGLIGLAGIVLIFIVIGLFVANQYVVLFGLVFVALRIGGKPLKTFLAKLISEAIEVKDTR